MTNNNNNNNNLCDNYHVSTFPPSSQQILNTTLLLLGPEGEGWPGGWLPLPHPTLNYNNNDKYDPISKSTCRVAQRARKKPSIWFLWRIFQGGWVSCTRSPFHRWSLFGRAPEFDIFIQNIFSFESYLVEVKGTASHLVSWEHTFPLLAHCNLSIKIYNSQIVPKTSKSAITGTFSGNWRTSRSSSCKFIFK